MFVLIDIIQTKTFIGRIMTMIQRLVNKEWNTCTLVVIKFYKMVTVLHLEISQTIQ